MSKKRCRSGAQLAEVLVAFGDALNVPRDSLLSALAEAQYNTGLVLNAPTLLTMRKLAPGPNLLKRHQQLTRTMEFLDWEDHFRFLFVAKGTREFVKGSSFFLTMKSLTLSTVRTSFALPKNALKISSFILLRPAVDNLKILNLNIGHKELAIARALFEFVGSSVVKLKFNITNNPNGGSTNCYHNFGGALGAINLNHSDSAEAHLEHEDAQRIDFLTRYFPGADTSYIDQSINLREMFPILQDLSGFRKLEQREQLINLPDTLVKMVLHPCYGVSPDFHNNMDFNSPQLNLDLRAFSRLKVLILSQPTYGKVLINSNSLEVLDMINSCKGTRTSFTTACNNLREIFSHCLPYQQSMYPYNIAEVEQRQSDPANQNVRFDQYFVQDTNLQNIAGSNVAFLHSSNVPRKCIVRMSFEDEGCKLTASVSLANGDETETPSDYLQYINNGTGRYKMPY